MTIKNEPGQNEPGQNERKYAALSAEDFKIHRAYMQQNYGVTPHAGLTVENFERMEMQRFADNPAAMRDFIGHRKAQTSAILETYRKNLSADELAELNAAVDKAASFFYPPLPEGKVFAEPPELWKARKLPEMIAIRINSDRKKIVEASIPSGKLPDNYTAPSLPKSLSILAGVELAQQPDMERPGAVARAVAERLATREETLQKAAGRG